MNTKDLMARLQAKYPYEKEYLQAVHEVLESIEEVYNQHPEFEDAKIVERIVEPERILTFKVTWVQRNPVPISNHLPPSILPPSKP